MKDGFAPALAATLVFEGGYSNHPKDPGGVTLEGIIQRVYDDFRRAKGLPRRPLTPQMRGEADWIAERDEIYRTRYWDLIKGNELPPGIDFAVFDGAVNSGPAQAAKWLQRALGVPADGVVGPQTLAAVRAAADHDAIVAGIQDRRLAMVQSLTTWKTFGKGWARRIAEVRGIGLAIAGGSREIPLPTGTASGKAYASCAKPAPPKTIGDLLAAGGAVSTTLSTAADALTPLADKSQVAAMALSILMVAGTLVAVGGIVYRSWAKAKAAQLADALDLKPPAFAGPDAAAPEVAS